MATKRNTINNEIIETKTKIEHLNYQAKYSDFKAPWAFFMQRETRRYSLMEMFEEEHNIELDEVTIIPYGQTNNPIAHFPYNERYYFEANTYELNNIEREDSTENIKFQSNGDIFMQRKIFSKESSYSTLTCHSNIFKPEFNFYLEGIGKTPSIEVTKEKNITTKEIDELTITQLPDESIETSLEYRIPKYQIEINASYDNENNINEITINFIPNSRNDYAYYIEANPSEILFYKVDDNKLKTELTKEEKILILTTDYLSLTSNKLIAIYLTKLFEGLQDSLLKEGYLNKKYFSQDILVPILEYINQEMQNYLKEIPIPSIQKNISRTINKDKKRINKVLTLK